MFVFTLQLLTCDAAAAAVTGLLAALCCLRFCAMVLDFFAFSDCEVFLPLRLRSCRQSKLSRRPECCRLKHGLGRQTHPTGYRISLTLEGFQWRLTRCNCSFIRLTLSFMAVEFANDICNNSYRALRWNKRIVHFANGRAS